MKQITIRVSEAEFVALSKEADKFGLDRPSELVKMRAVLNFRLGKSCEAMVPVYVPNVDEITAYVEEKKLGSVETFCTYAMEKEMSRHPLTESQKKRLASRFEVRR